MTTCFYRQAHQIIIQTKICNYLETKILPSWLKTSLKKELKKISIKKISKMSSKLNKIIGYICTNKESIKEKLMN